MFHSINPHNVRSLWKCLFFMLHRYRPEKNDHEHCRNKEVILLSNIIPANAVLAVTYPRPPDVTTNFNFGGLTHLSHNWAVMRSTVKRYKLIYTTRDFWHQPKSQHIGASVFGFHESNSCHGQNCTRTSMLSRQTPSLQGLHGRRLQNIDTMRRPNIQDSMQFDFLFFLWSKHKHRIQRRK